MGFLEGNGNLFPSVFYSAFYLQYTLLLKILLFNSYSISFNSLLSISQVGNASRFWTWMTNIFVPGIFATNWYNGDEESNNVYISDKSSVLIGMPRVRQLRVQEGKKHNSILCTDLN